MIVLHPVFQFQVENWPLKQESLEIDMCVSVCVYVCSSQLVWYDLCGWLGISHKELIIYLSWVG